MTTGVLVLNATFEPLNVVKLERAVCMVVQDKAVIVEEVEGRSIRSATKTFPCPSVVRLRYYVKVPWRRRRPPITNRNVLGRDHYKCAYCNADLDTKSGTVDHIVPTSRGGPNTWMNVVAACVFCNSKKANSLLEELGWELLFQPTVPHEKTWLVIGLQEREQHAKYLRPFEATL